MYTSDVVEDRLALLRRLARWVRYMKRALALHDTRVTVIPDMVDDIQLAMRLVHKMPLIPAPPVAKPTPRKRRKKS